MKKVAIMTVMFFCAICSFVHSAGKYDSYVKDAFENNIIHGNENGDFESEKIASRAEFITMTTKFFDLKPGAYSFTDVGENDWFYENMSLAGANGILSGYEDGSARPYAPITCQEAVTIIGRYYKMTESIGTRDGVMDYALPYFNYAVKNSLFVEMTPEHTDPGHYMNKGELLALLYKYNSENLKTIRFLSGYPKLASKGLFNNITLSVMTNRPCKIYYGISKKGEKAVDTDKLLCQVPYANTEVIAGIFANLNEEYDIYLKAVVDSGEASRLASIKSVMPFAFTKGAGTQNSPYIIYTENQLNQIRQRPKLAYRLDENIQITKEWIPIENFSGILDGNGYKISGIEITGEGENIGLFSNIQGGTVKNLTVSADISGKRNVGIIAGHISDGIIENCVAEGFVSAKTNCVGGICGINEGTVKNSVAVMYSTAASGFAGGITGQNFGTVSGCLVATEIVAADMYAGGIAGTNQGGVIKNCVFAGRNVYDTMTHSSGRITTNRHDAVTSNNYCYSGAATNADFSTSDKNSAQGQDAELEELENMSFYLQNLGWNENEWEIRKNGFIYPIPRGIASPEPEPGRMMCLPYLIKTPADLKKIDADPKAHYALAEDIYITTTWKSLCKIEGFSGSLNGRGHSIYNLRLNGQDGLFSNISGGTVRNLNIRDAVSYPTSDGAIISGCNYGYIENCKVSAVINTQKAGAIGIITLENYGEIKNCDVSGELISDNDNAVIGGICSNNSGHILNCYFKGKITATGDNAVIGGIAGCDDGGYLFENHSEVEVLAENCEAYIGGVCGMAIGSQIYKNSSVGNLSADCEVYSYIGGICGSLQEALIYNCYALGDIFAQKQTGYIGGIAGCVSASNLQSSYSAGSIFSQGVGEVYTGGICGYSEESFIMQNVALNPAINARGFVGAVYGGQAVSEASDNFSIDRMLINSQLIGAKEENCIIKNINVLNDIDFYFKPLSQGGALGWGNVAHGEDIWTASGTKYPYPVLSNVKRQEALKIPTYK